MRLSSLKGSSRALSTTGIDSYSVGTIHKNFRWARIDKNLFELLQDEDVRAKLRTTLITTYIQSQKRVIDKVIPMRLAAILVA